MRRIFLSIFLTITIITIHAQNKYAAVKKGDYWGYIDQKNEWVIEPAFDAAKDFYCNIALVKENGVWNYINTNGEIINRDKNYIVKHDFSENLARVLENGLWGYVDQTGNYVIQPQFDGARDFAYGLAAVQIGKLWGYIDHSGAFFVEPQFLNAKDFHDNVGIVEVNKRELKYINKSKRIFPDHNDYEVKHYFSENRAPVLVKRKWGLHQ